MVRSALLLVLLAAPAFAEPAVVVFPAVGQPAEVEVSGRVLKDAPTGGSSALSRNLRRLTASTWDGAELEISFEGQTIHTKAGEDGVFDATFKAPESKPFTPGLHPVTASVQGASSTVPVKVVDARAAFFVISDFDDTIAVTNVLQRGKFIDAALMQDADTQPAVRGMAPLYRCLVEEKQPESAVALVTGSPHQYAGRIAKFLVKNGFPFTGIYPRNLGFDTLSNYKQPVIRKLLKATSQKVILIGDSGEHDPEVYAEIRKEFPDRVLAVYIRDVGRDEDATRFDGDTLFHDPREVAKDALSHGWLSQACYSAAFPEESAK